MFEKVTPESCGISSKNIIGFIEAMCKGEKDQETHSFMLLRHGKILFEGYFSPYNENTKHSLFSVSKTFAGTAIGFLASEGKLNIDDYIYTYFPELIVDGINEENKKIKIKDLLSMSFGQSGGAVHESQEKDRNQNNSMLFEFFHRKKDIDCGKSFRYDSFGTYMLSALVFKITGKNIPEFLEDKLFRPLDIDLPYYIKDEEGISVGYTGMRMSLFDLAKVGQTYLDKGKFNNKQVIPESWIDIATKKHIGTESCGTGKDWQEGYCFQFWKGRYNTYRFCGAFGQMCVVMPELDAVFVINSGYDNDKLYYILDKFYEHIMFNMHQSPLPEDKKSNKELEEIISNLSITYNFSSVSPVAQFIDNKIFEINPSGGYTSVGFKMNGDIITTTLYSSNGNFTFDAGFKAPVWGKAVGTEFAVLEISDNSETIGTACFKSKNELEITLRLFGTPTILKVKGIFGIEDKVEIYTLRGKF